MSISPAFAPCAALGTAAFSGNSVSTRFSPRSTESKCMRPRRAPRMMAGGVPKVPYKAPGAQSYEFIDIFNRLYRERIMYIGQVCCVVLFSSSAARMHRRSTSRYVVSLDVLHNFAGYAFYLL